MTAPSLSVPAFEHGVVRLFGVDVSDPLGRRLQAELPEGDGSALETALGAKQVDPYWVDLVATQDIGEIGLGAYLAEGWGVPRDQLDAARKEIEAAPDHLLIVPSRAFGGEAQELEPTGAIEPLVSFTVSDPMPPRRPMPPAAVEPPTEPRPTPAPDREASRRRRGAVNAAIILAIAIVVILLLAAFA